LKSKGLKVLISSLLAYPSFISSIKLEKPSDVIGLNKARLKGYFKIANFASVSLILGLALLAASFV
jgi:hypothetical protein